MNKVLLVSSLVAISGLAQADTLGLTIGVNAWQQSFDGSVRSGNLGSSIHLEKAFSFLIRVVISLNNIPFLG